MGWLGRRDRRQGPRPPGPDRELTSQPTYIVERDAPSGPPMDPTGRWFSKAIKRLRGETYDAYPDHDVPWHVLGPPGPAVPARPIRDRLPRPRTHPVALYVKRYGRLREVKLRGSSLEIALDILNRRIVAGWVMDEIAATLASMEEEDTLFDEHGTGQGLAEYALILALIAIVAIVALVILGGQIADALRTVGDSILPQ